MKPKYDLTSVLLSAAMCIAGWVVVMVMMKNN
jgi:hypothetical protein